MAITLCILLALSTLCTTSVVVADSSNGGAQLFAVNLYLTFSPPPRHSLAREEGLRIVSWMKKPDFNPDNPARAPEGMIASSLFSSDLRCKNSGLLPDLYTASKRTSFFMRI